MPIPSAPSEIIAIDGVHGTAMLGPVTRISGTATNSAIVHSSSAIARPEAPRPTRHGSTRPWRSERRPKYRLIEASRAPDATKLPPTPAPPPPGPGRRRPELVQPQRRQHVERAEHQPDEDHDPHPGRDPRVAEAGEHLAH